LSRCQILTGKTVIQAIQFSLQDYFGYDRLVSHNMIDIRSPMKPDFKGGPVGFLKEVRNELKKVTWPTREQVIKLTIVVVVISLVFGIYIGGLDLVLTQATGLILNK